MKNLAFIVNFEKEGSRETAIKIISALRGRAAMYCDEAAEGLLPLQALGDKELFGKCPTVVTLGGDGTIIRAASRCAPYGNVLLGINLGRLGFLATVEGTPAEAAAEFILSGFGYEERTMLKCEIIKDGSPAQVCHALNDIVLSRSSGRILQIRASMDGKLITSVRADGLVVATPTGSTAYSLSAGGPLAAPDLDIFLLSPICPHNLSARAMVLPANKTVTLETSGDAFVSVDGRDAAPLGAGERLEISKSPYVTRLAVQDGTDFYELVRRKLTVN